MKINGNDRSFDFEVQESGNGIACGTISNIPVRVYLAIQIMSGDVSVSETTALKSADNLIKAHNETFRQKEQDFMTSRDFCYWMQGFFELSHATKITEKEFGTIKNHLAMVFKHEIDPSFGDKKQQEILAVIHDQVKFNC